MDFYNMPLMMDEIHRAEMRKKLLNLLYEPDQFTAWLRRHDEKEMVGKAGLSNLDPLARFLQVFTGYECDLLGNEKVYVRSTEGYFTEINLVGWVVRYLKAITRNDQNYGDSVTAGECLAVLEKI